jgi:hypothetical protein
LAAVQPHPPQKRLHVAIGHVDDMLLVSARSPPASAPKRAVNGTIPLAGLHEYLPEHPHISVELSRA